MFTPTLRCECAQPGLIDTMRKWSIEQGFATSRVRRHATAMLIHELTSAQFVRR